MSDIVWLPEYFCSKCGMCLERVSPIRETVTLRHTVHPEWKDYKRFECENDGKVYMVRVESPAYEVTCTPHES